MAIAVSLGALRNLSDDRVDRALRDVAQEIRHRTRRVSLDREMRRACAKIRNGGAGSPDLGSEHAAACGVDRHRSTLESQLAVDSFDRRPMICKIERDPSTLHSDDELAPLAVGKREMGKIAGELHSRVSHFSLGQRAPKPLVRRLVSNIRQIAVGLARVTAR